MTFSESHSEETLDKIVVFILSMAVVAMAIEAFIGWIILRGV